MVIGNHLLNIFPDLKVGDWLTIEIEWQGDEVADRRHLYIHRKCRHPPLLYVNYEYLSRLVGRPDMVYSLRVLTDRSTTLPRSKSDHRPDQGRV